MAWEDPGAITARWKRWSPVRFHAGWAGSGSVFRGLGGLRRGWRRGQERVDELACRFGSARGIVLVEQVRRARETGLADEQLLVRLELVKPDVLQHVLDIDRNTAHLITHSIHPRLGEICGSSALRPASPRMRRLSGQV